MNTKKMTEGAVLAALFVILTMLAIATGIGYSLYLDIIVPIFVTVVFLKLDYKYMILMCVTTFLIIIFTVGNIVSAIWLAQGMIIGIVCTIFISKKSNFLDDIFYGSILGTFVMILIDIYFSALTSYSFIKDAQDSINGAVKIAGNYLGTINVTSENVAAFCNILIAALPMGTILVVYIASLFMAKRLRALDKNSKDKYKIIANFKRCGGYIAFSEEVYYFSIIYVVMIELLKAAGLSIPFVYLKTVLSAIEVICCYALIKDSLSFVSKYLIYKKRSRGLYILFTFGLLTLLFAQFKITLTALVAFAMYINKKMQIRKKQLIILNKIVNES